jgi:hypothetical protein
MELLLAARNSPIFSEVGYHRARIDTNLAILCKLYKRNDEANEYFKQARTIASRLGANALISKIDSASKSK